MDRKKERTNKWFYILQLSARVTNRRGLRTLRVTQNVRGGDSLELALGSDYKASQWLYQLCDLLEKPLYLLSLGLSIYKVGIILSDFWSYHECHENKISHSVQRGLRKASWKAEPGSLRSMGFCSAELRAGVRRTQSSKKEQRKQRPLGRNVGLH